MKKEDVNRNIRILNCCDKNEYEIKKCEIRINEKLIPFNYYLKFERIGKYIIKYSFKNNINESSYMFYQCSSLTSINLSNFNINNANHMNSMFIGCNNLEQKNIIIKDKNLLNNKNIFDNY